MTIERGATKRGKALRAATGRDYDQWFQALDTWGAPDRSYHQIAAWLTGDHDVSDWWAQKLIVEYEESRGLRAPGVRRDGTFTVGVTRTIAAPTDRVLRAFRDSELRERWLPGAGLLERPTRSAGTVRFDYGEDGTRVTVTVAPTAGGKAQAAVEHGRLPDATAAAARKAFWRERLTALRSLLEADHDAG